MYRCVGSLEDSYIYSFFIESNAKCCPRNFWKGVYDCKALFLFQYPIPQDPFSGLVESITPLQHMDDQQHTRQLVSFWFVLAHWYTTLHIPHRGRTNIFSVKHCLRSSLLLTAGVAPIGTPLPLLHWQAHSSAEVIITAGLGPQCSWMLLLNECELAVLLHDDLQLMFSTPSLLFSSADAPLT